MIHCLYAHLFDVRLALPDPTSSHSLVLTNMPVMAPLTAEMKPCMRPSLGTIDGRVAIGDLVQSAFHSMSTAEKIRKEGRKEEFKESFDGV